jgi:guanylate kinase
LFDGDYSYSWNDAVTKIGRLGCFETQQSITLNTESVITNKIDQQTILNYEFKSYNTDLSGNPLYEFRLVNANKGGDFLIKIVGRSMEELNSILSNWGYEFVRTKDKEGNDKWKMQKVTEEEKNRYERLIKKLKENQDYRPRINADGTISD